MSMLHQLGHRSPALDQVKVWQQAVKPAIDKGQACQQQVQPILTELVGSGGTATRI